jgi:hypothetical protein
MTKGADFAVSRIITRHAYGAVRRVISVISTVWAELRKHFAYRGASTNLLPSSPGGGFQIGFTLAGSGSHRT